MDLPADSMSCVGGPFHGRNLPNVGGVAHVIAFGKKVVYERDTMNLMGRPFPFWRWSNLPHDKASDMIVMEARDLIRDMVRETFEVASDMAKA